MNLQQQNEHFESFTARQKEILLKKGSDYATQDRLSNFKRAGSIINITPEQNCLSLIATKVARLGVLLSNNVDPQNESIRDSILDLANYAILLDALIEDRESEIPKKRSRLGLIW